MSKIKWAKAVAASRVAREARQRQIAAAPEPKRGPKTNAPNRFAIAGGASPVDKARVTLAKVSILEK